MASCSYTLQGAASSPGPEPTSTSMPPLSAPPSTNYVQLLLEDLIHTAPPAAHHIVSFLPPPTRKALSGACKTGLALAQYSRTALSLPPPVRDLPRSEIAHSYHNVTTLNIPAPSVHTPFAAWQAGLEHLCDTCPSLLAKVRTLSMNEVFFAEDDGLAHSFAALQYELWRIPTSVHRLICSCTSLQELQLCTRQGDLLLTITLPAPCHPPAGWKQHTLQQLLPECAEGNLNVSHVLTHQGLAPYITHMTIAPGSFPDIVTACEVITRASTLTSLHLCINRGESDMLAALLQCLTHTPQPQITSLVIENRGPMQGDFPDPLPCIMRHSLLRKLDIKRLSSFPSGLQLPHLTELQMQVKADVPVSAYSGIGSLQGLRFLCLYGFESRHPPTGHIMTLLLGLKSLHYLQKLHILCAVNASAMSDQLGHQRVHLPALEELKGDQTRSLSPLWKHLDAPCLKKVVDVICPGQITDLAALPLSVIGDSEFGLEAERGDAEERGGFNVVKAVSAMPWLLKFPGLCSALLHNRKDSVVLHLAEELGEELQHLDLTELRLKDTGDAALAALAMSCGELKTLGLAATSPKGFTNRGLAAVATNMARLQCLRLRGCQGLDDECFTALVRGCPELQYIQMDGLEGVSEQGLMSLAQHNNVGLGKKLVIRCSRGLTANEILCLHQAGWEAGVVTKQDEYERAMQQQQQHARQASAQASWQ